MKKYEEDELLALSGVQHYAFCPRQWALIHIEKLWQENLRTIKGKQLHERVDDPEFFEARGNVLVTRSVPLSSYTLGLYGVADMVEFHSVKEGGVTLKGRHGYWHPVPVEYKKGRPKQNDIDEVQLCAQAICLEEMLADEIAYGYIFYGETRRRTKVEFSSELRDSVFKKAEQMHTLYRQQITPKATTGKHCNACSLENLCLPKITSTSPSVAKYIDKYLSSGLLR